MKSQPRINTDFTSLKLKLKIVKYYSLQFKYSNDPDHIEHVHNRMHNINSSIKKNPIYVYLEEIFLFIKSPLVKFFYSQVIFI
jgi:hypothetical protein